jgi:hypothetical protein
MTEQPQEPTDSIGGADDKSCFTCDEHHKDGNCGTDSPDPDILYDEMHTLD